MKAEKRMARTTAGVKTGMPEPEMEKKVPQRFYFSGLLYRVAGYYDALNVIDAMHRGNCVKARIAEASGVETPRVTFLMMQFERARIVKNEGTREEQRWVLTSFGMQLHASALDFENEAKKMNEGPEGLDALVDSVVEDVCGK